jgi:hypothetical protein
MDKKEFDWFYAFLWFGAGLWVASFIVMFYR